MCASIGLGPKCRLEGGKVGSLIGRTCEGLPGEYVGVAPEAVPYQLHV